MNNDNKGLQTLGNDYLRLRNTAQGMEAWFIVFLAAVTLFQVIGLVKCGDIPLPKIRFWALVRELLVIFVVCFVVLAVIMAYTT